MRKRSRAAESRPRLSALDDMLDALELQRGNVAGQLAKTADVEPDMSERLEDVRRQINPEAVQRIMALLLYYVRDDADTTTKQPLVEMTRRFIQKVVISKTPGHQPAELTVHGQIASILAAMEAATIMEERLKLLQGNTNRH